MIILNVCNSLFFGWFILTQLHVIESNILTHLVDNVEGDLANLVNDITTGNFELSNLCTMNTTERILYYNYTPEVHTVINDRGDVLTLIRCNSKKSYDCKKKVVVFQHGLFGSSDDGTVNGPKQGLAYVLADAGYDVWLPNNRGNCYSRHNLYLDPNKPFGEYWNFSWDDIALQDFPFIFNYIRARTKQKKFYYIGHSQGTSSIMAFLSEFPEWNEYFYAVSLMAPVGFVTHSKLHFLLGRLQSLPFIREGGVEILPRTSIWKLIGSLCKGLVAEVCLTYLRLLAGADSNENMNKRTIILFFCTVPSGSSVYQFRHYISESIHNYYGRKMNASTDCVPENFRVDRITVPLSLHYSNTDPYANTADVNRLIPMLTGTRDLFVQKLDNFNHFDFAISVQANDLVYSKILCFFEKHYTPCHD